MDQGAAFNVLTHENWIAGLPTVVREAVEASMSVIDVPAGEEIARAGEPCTRMFQVDRGYVRLSGLHEDGTEALITIYIPGNCYAETALVAHRPYNHSSVALVDSRLRVLHADQFWELYHRHGEIPEALCRKFAGSITRQIASREMRATMKLGRRVAMMFHNFATFCPVEAQGPGVAIGFPITQLDIATLFDVTRQSVHREIALLRDLAIIDRQNGSWVVNDLERLRHQFA